MPLRADWAAIDVIDESKLFRRVAAAHVDPELEKLLYEIDKRWPLHASGSNLRGQAVASRRPVALYRVTEGDLRRVARSDEHREMLRRLGLRSAIWVPLIARDRVLGVMSVGYGDERRRYTEDRPRADDRARPTGGAGGRQFAALSGRTIAPRHARRRSPRSARTRWPARAIDELLTQAAQVLARVMAVPFVEVLEMVPRERRLKLVAGVGWRRGPDW